MTKNNHKYIFVVGGVMSGVGKGVASSSIGAILQGEGFKVNPVKVDPYLNVDAGTMNPTEHGEVFVLDSGLECDQDMGNYERFMNLSLTPEDYITSGMVYKYVIEKERNLGYGGKCVEAIPHVTGEILRRIERAAAVSRSHISIIEIGGTVGDYQNILFIEAARVLKLKYPEDVLFMLVSFLPIPGTLGEMKTKPTQNAVRQLNSYGVQPDIIIARSKVALDQKRKEKLAVWCNVRAEHVISAPDIESIYDVPLNFEHDHLGKIILTALSLKSRKRTKGLSAWHSFVKKRTRAKREVSIAIIGKYFDTGDFVLADAYISVIEALKISAYSEGVEVKTTWINSKDIERDKLRLNALKKFQGIIVPGGFGSSGVEGKIKVIEYARGKKIPYFGLCYGMQLLVVEYARNVLKLRGAHTTEIDSKTPHPVIDLMPEQKKLIAEGAYGATMRLGSYPAKLLKGTIAHSAYGRDLIHERHRHRFEVNPEYVARLENAGLVFSGKSPDGALAEIAELPRSAHPFFLGTQFHPEFLARPLAPHPLFNAFIKVCQS